MAKIKLKKAYSFLVGVKKSVKNVAITFVLPGVAYALLNSADWMPAEGNAVVSLCVAVGSYMIKNYIENRK